MNARSTWFAPVMLVVGVACLAVSGNFVGADGAMVIRLLAGLLVVAAVLWGAWHHGAGARVAWLLMAIGLCGWVVDDALWDTFDAAGFAASSGWYDVVNVCYLVMYPVIFVALIRLVNARGRERSLGNVVDSAIMFLTAVLIVQLVVIDPQVNGDAGLDWFSVSYPFGDALLLSAIGWLVFTRARRNPCAWLLGTGLVLLIAVDAAWETTDGIRFVSLDQLLNPLYPVSYALIAAAVLHPGAAHLAQRTATPTAELHPGRLAFLCAALGMIPIAAFLDGTRGLVVDVSISALVGAIAIRLADLMRSIQREHRRAEASAARFANLAAAAPVAILESDADLTIVFANHVAERFLGTSMVGMAAGQLITEVVDDRDQPTLNQAVARVQEGIAMTVQARIRDAAGSQRWVSWSAVPVRKVPGPFAGAFVSITDITPIKDAEEMLTLQATHDVLTGLPNRRMLRDRLTTAISRLSRMPGTLAVLFLDLDDFKAVNDHLGHDAGDELLDLVANRIFHTVRAEDTVARWGGDEFVVVLERIGDRTHALAVADKIIRAIGAPATLTQAEVRVSASIGIAMGGDSQVDPDALLRNADSAMYASKRAGRGLVRVFDEPNRRPRLAAVPLEDPA